MKERMRPLKGKMRLLALVLLVPLTACSPAQNASGTVAPEATATPGVAPTPVAADAAQTPNPTAAPDSAPADADDTPQWSGYYERDDTGLHIANNKGTSFSYTFTPVDGEAFGGVAAVDAFQAESGDLRFTLAADHLRIDVAQQSAGDHAAFVGTYAFYPGPQSDAPFTYEGDIAGILRGYTIGGVIDLLCATGVTWRFDGEAVGTATLTLHCPGGTVSVCVPAQDENSLFVQREPEAPEDLSVLPGGLREMTADIVGASWEDRTFELPTIRGVAVGDPAEWVLRAFARTHRGGDAIYDMTLLNPDVDPASVQSFVGGRWVRPDPDNAVPSEGIEYVWAELNDPELADWHEYYGLTFWIEGDKVSSITLDYDTDPE